MLDSQHFSQQYKFTSSVLVKVQNYGVGWLRAKGSQMWPLLAKGLGAKRRKSPPQAKIF
jgi:hypothetical protein